MIMNIKGKQANWYIVLFCLISHHCFHLVIWQRKRSPGNWNSTISGWGVGGKTRDPSLLLYGMVSYHHFLRLFTMKHFIYLEPVLTNHPIGHKNMISQDRWSLVTGWFTLKCKTFCPKLVVLQDRWSLMAVVSQDRFHCIHILTSTICRPYM